MKKITLITLTTLLISFLSTSVFAQSQTNSLESDEYFDLQLCLGNNHASQFLNGIQWSLGINNAEQGINGWQFALGANLSGGVTKGLQLSLGFNETQKELLGVQFSTGFNNTAYMKGLQATAGVNLAEQVEGAQVGTYNQTDVLMGLQAGLVNLTIEKRSHGLQAGLVNNSTSDVFDGIQAGFINTAKDVEGLQAGFLNKSEKMKGLSVGFINVADSLDGLSIAPFSFIKDGIADFELSYSDNFQYNLSFRSGKEYFYFIWLGGYQNIEEFKRYAFGAGIGSQWNISHKGLLKGSFELTHSFVKDDRQFDWGDGQNYLAQGRLNFIVNIIKPISLIAGPTINYSFQKGSWLDEEAPIFSRASTEIYSQRNESLFSNNASEHKVWLGFHAGVRIHLY